MKISRDSVSVPTWKPAIWENRDQSYWMIQEKTNQVIEVTEGGHFKSILFVLTSCYMCIIIN